MIVIVLPNGKEWYKANWVFRRLAEDMKKRLEDDQNVRQILDAAQANGGLFLDELTATQARTITEAIAAVINHATGGEQTVSSPSKSLDVAGDKMYLNAIKELLGLLEYG